MQQQNYNTFSLWTFIRDIAQYKHDVALRSEEMLTNLASQMLVAFSAFLAGLAFTGSAIFKLNGLLHILLLIGVVFVFISLTFVLAALWLRPATALPSIKGIKHEIEKNAESFITDEQRLKFWSDTLEGAIKRREENNQQRVRWITYAMIAFAIAVIIALVILFSVMYLSVV